MNSDNHLSVQTSSPEELNGEIHPKLTAHLQIENSRLPFQELLTEKNHSCKPADLNDENEFFAKKRENLHWQSTRYDRAKLYDSGSDKAHILWKKVDSPLHKAIPEKSILYTCLNSLPGTKEYQLLIRIEHMLMDAFFEAKQFVPHHITTVQRTSDHFLPLR